MFTRELEELKNVQKALESLDRNHFIYEEKSKRYRLKIDINFASSSSNILDTPHENRNEILLAGKNLMELFDKISEDNPNIEYLLIIEGTTQRDYKNRYLSNPDNLV